MLKLGLKSILKFQLYFPGELENQSIKHRCVTDITVLWKDQTNLTALHHWQPKVWMHSAQLSFPSQFRDSAEVEKLTKVVKYKDTTQRPTRNLFLIIVNFRIEMLSSKSWLQISFIEL